MTDRPRAQQPQRKENGKQGKCECEAVTEAMSAKISLYEKFGLFSERWQPKIIAAANGQEVKIVKVKGEFPWHHHDTEDEFFLVWKGRFRVEFATMSSIWDRANASSSRVAPSTAPGPMRRPKAC